jgi:hypothetical protein
MNYDSGQQGNKVDVAIDTNPMEANVGDIVTFYNPRVVVRCYAPVFAHTRSIGVADISSVDVREHV